MRSSVLILAAASVVAIAACSGESAESPGSSLSSTPVDGAPPNVVFIAEHREELVALRHG